eukprot:TRINITY_DN35039_c0_g1_i1.p2 TRINITY_DN35039_c0_g1~~TRINITY_DN35039_c0_g1_i1.p2  ORF type:complete len:141 (+),score=55.33 TRINITY_DN35039_c0_g1_i1:129-551(+)
MVYTMRPLTLAACAAAVLLVAGDEPGQPCVFTNATISFPSDLQVEESSPECREGGLLHSNDTCVFGPDNGPCQQIVRCNMATRELTTFNCTSIGDSDDDVPYGGVAVLLVLVPSLCAAGFVLYVRLRDRHRASELADEPA